MMINNNHYLNFDKTNFFFPVSAPEHLNYMYVLRDIISKNMEKLLLDNSIITAVYGSFSGAIWNDGRTISKKRVSTEYIRATIDSLNKAGLAYRATFTNSFISSEYVNDLYCNNILDIMDNGFGNEAIVFHMN